MWVGARVSVYVVRGSGTDVWGWCCCGCLRCLCRHRGRGVAFLTAARIVTHCDAPSAPLPHPTGISPLQWKPGDRTVVDDPDRAQDYFAAVNPAGKVAAAEEAKRDSGSGGGGGAGEPAGVLYCSSSAEVDAAVSAAGALPVVVMYSATWCGKCKALYPSFRGYADEHGDAARFVKVDVDVAEDVADDAAVRSVPTVVVHKAGKELARYTGANASEVLKVVSSAL